MTQPPLIGRPDRRSEIWSRVRAGHAVDDREWRDALAAGQHVGTCGAVRPSGKTCGHPLRPLEPYDVGEVTWYPAECTSEICDHQPAARGPRAEKPKKGGA